MQQEADNDRISRRYKWKISIHTLFIDTSMWRSWGVVDLVATSCSCGPPGVNHTSLSGAVRCGISGGGVDSGSVDWGLG